MPLIIAEWPEEWTPLRPLRVPINAAIVRSEREWRGEPHVRFPDWRWLLFFHWESYGIELQGRPWVPEAKPRVLRHPEAERRGHLYDLAALDDARLAYPGAPPSYFDLHVRGRPLPADRAGVTIQRAELMFAVWADADYPQWTAAQALDAARAAYPNHPLFVEKTSRVWRDAWSAAQGMRRD